jgi:hypothetical protein
MESFETSEMKKELKICEIFDVFDGILLVREDRNIKH